MTRLQIFNRIDVPEGLSQSRGPFFNLAAGRDFSVRAAGDRTEITLYDEIGYWGVTAADLRAQLKDIKGGTIVLKVNSPGGDVFDGIAMFNDLSDHPARVEVEVTGIAASAASLVAMAGDKITVASNAFLMIHNAWTIAAGNRHAMIETAKVLEQIDGALARTYAERTGRPVTEIAGMMDAETWLDGPKAKELGFADAVGSEADAQAAFDLSVFAKVPEALRRAVAGAPKTKRDFERALRDAGTSKTAAAAFVSGGYSALARRDAAAESTDWIEAAKRLTATLSNRK